ncbi:MAG TPA: ATP synthase F1 subunit delta [Thermoanaerobaculia bacterium]|nr:ATP synthase F1 subunit delta [Thermoanaerobaculia bacterium]
MATHVSEKLLPLARVYARSLYWLAAERGVTEGLLEELAGLAGLLEERSDLAAFFGSPLARSESRQSVIENLFRGKFSDLLVDALQVMNRKGRLELLPAVAEVYRDELRRASGVVDVRVTTAVPLGAGSTERLRSAADRLTGKKCHLIEEVDPSLLGGMVLRIDDHKLDYSVARNLEKLSAALAERASKEILSGRTALAEG